MSEQALTPSARARNLAWWLPRLGVAAALWATSCAAAAVNHALLVGVGRYPELAPDLQLQAPVNDMRLMRDVLMQRGFERAHIEVLTDGLEGAQLPTRAAIVAALQRLGSRVREGDSVYLHFSGHGSLQPVATPHVAAAAPRIPPETGWQPVFLPRDARAWDGKSPSTVPNAITDTTLRELIDGLNDRGAFVFAVFDACHSARLVRGSLPGTDGALLRVRQVAPSALGLAAAAPPSTSVLPIWAGPPPQNSADTRGATGAGTGSRASGSRRGGAAYFYAAQSVELAASVPLRVGERSVWHGLFTWHIAQALALGEPMTHRQLGQHILSRFDQLPAVTANPLFSGDGLDQPVFGQKATSVRQWPLEHRQGRLMLPAGALSGLAEGALFAVLADPLAPAPSVSPGSEQGAPAGGAAGAARPPRSVALPVARGTLGYARAQSMAADQSLLEPVAWQGWAAPSPGALPPGAWARLISNPPAFALHVAVDPGGCADACVAGRAILQLRRDGVPGVDVRWVADVAAADLTLLGTERGLQWRLKAADNPSDAWGAAARPEGGAALEALVREAGAALHRVARMRNLLQLAARVTSRPRPAELHLSLRARRQGAGGETPITGDQLARLQPGDRLVLEGHNTTGDPLDLAVFWLGADQGIQRLFPLDARDAPRLAGGERLPPIGLRIDPGSAGVERLLVITLPMRRGHEVADFRFLEQSPLTRLRGGESAELQALLDARFADHRLRNQGGPALPADRLNMQVFAFRIEP